MTIVWNELEIKLDPNKGQQVLTHCYYAYEDNC
jgi:hypothetical protein